MLTNSQAIVDMEPGNASPLVSVVVPVYNVCRYICHFARSLFSQTYPEIQFVFVNDGTKDDSMERLRKVLQEEFPSLEPRVTVVEQPNRGLPAARRRGLQEVRGDFVLQVDSDDWMEPDMVAVLVEEALRTGSDLVYCDYYKEKKSKTETCTEAVYPEEHRDDMFLDLIHGRNFHGYFWNKLVRTSLYDNYLVFPMYGMREDLTVTLQLLFYAGDRISHVARPLYHYRRTNADAVSRMKLIRRRRESGRNMMLLFDGWRGREGRTPLTGYEDAFLMQAAYYGVASRDYSVFKQYPYLLEYVLARPTFKPTGLRRGRQTVLNFSLWLYRRFHRT